MRRWDGVVMKQKLPLFDCHRRLQKKLISMQPQHPGVSTESGLATEKLPVLHQSLTRTTPATEYDSRSEKALCNSLKLLNSG